MKPAPNPHRENYIAGLDGLRGLAALAVFGVHFNQIVRLDSRWGPFNIEMLLANGNHAVSLFFSLSGFLLSLPYWKAMVDHRPFPDVRTYLLRRTARILPAYYVALTALIIIGALWRIPDARADILLHYIFLFNFAEFSIFSINPPFWTLAVEIQFYLLLPCIFLLINKSSPHKPLQFITVVAVGSYGLQYLLMGSVSRIIPWPFNPWLTWIRPHGAVLSHSILANLHIFLMGVAASKLYLDLERNGNASNLISCNTADSIFWTCFLPVKCVKAGPDISKGAPLPWHPDPAAMPGRGF